MQASSVGAVQWWAQQLSELSSNGQCHSPHFLKPYHFVLTALEVKRRQFKKLTLPEELTKYAVRMNLWEAAGLEDPTEVGKNPATGRFLPVEALRDESTVAASAKKLALIAANHGADPDTVDSLEIALMEILENCFAHAKMDETLWGLACAQAWQGGRKAQIAIADCGIGIRSSLSENEALVARLDVENGCEIATEYGVTSKPGAGHDGYGLTLARQLLEQNGGTLIVMSCEEYFSSSNGAASRGRLTCPWRGTLVVLEWNTDRPLSVKPVYESWPLTEGMTDDDYNF